jgi:hypothetical protein
MFDCSRQLQIYLNLKKCIFFVPFGNLLGHIVCMEGILVDPTKVVVILNMPLELDEAQFLHIFIRLWKRIGRRLGMIGILRLSLLCKVIKFCCMTVSIKSIQGNYKCIGLDPS